MQQLDWVSECYQVPHDNIEGINIWATKDGFDGGADLECEFLAMNGNIISFYVINGAWSGKLDVVNKTIYIEDTKRTVNYHKFELIY